MSSEERELKLTPRDAALLDALWQLDELGPFQVTARRTEEQRNSFFDTRERALRQAHIGFRRRTIAGQKMATWTLKAEGGLFRGIATRPEVELQLDSDMPPALAIGTLGEVARQRGASALAEQVGDALVGRGLPLAQPVLEMKTVRRVLDLEAPAERWRCEMALDTVSLIEHPRHTEVEIEVELKRGDDTALEAARAAIETLGPVDESVGSKLSRALDHLEHCTCST
jgi:inorganic triphosphatase YgiF